MCCELGCHVGMMWESLPSLLALWRMILTLTDGIHEEGGSATGTTLLFLHWIGNIRWLFIF